MAEGGKTCEKSYYYYRRVAEAVLREADIAELKDLALELVIAEVKAKIVMCGGGEEERRDAESLLEDIEKAKKLLYKAYVLMSTKGRSRKVVRWI
ncbi:hypothetical protein [Thermofilum pendens]|uniref:Uncharacterized protein n=1 Tax=Thermofilum pendens (strain DSM 2475 / Hrk 5) TaxID=368408 RepID=A1RW66_THEPD|nr:hypothetical protein [Thermofilum pendens]ABL77446.1 hypothetical protein Tpen_0036 [Thermofilum pendens Hrk 5]